MISRLNTASVGDVHLGHPNTPTVHILGNLRRAFPDNEETGQLDLIIIEGDLFDRLLNAPDPNITEIYIWMYEFLAMCYRRRISVRFLEGTPSHDYRQTKMVDTVMHLTGLQGDVRYIDTLSIEHHPLGCTILYVPDEWRPNPDDTYQEVCQLMREQGLAQVDLAVMHGAFEYQLPSHVKVPMHQSARYIPLVKHYIFIGHIHKSSRYENILAAGSFDRLAHGEEDPKGHFRVSIDTEHGDRIVFVENTGAQIYRTIDCTGLVLSEALEKIQGVAESVPEESYLRVLAHRDDPILVNVELLRRHFPAIHWSTKVELGEPETQANLLVDVRKEYVEVEITPANIHELMAKRLVSKGYAPELIERCLKLLEQAA